ncbi:exopolysaccharide biosynthesis polyprenyl glycosylphosphotransferase, partial [Auraticoccus sp. F435]|nr:exopolysaccharide biosynthesis polyprenyl glycosylphosphotransferase [Auraticoccus cholistanensis]
MPLMDSAVPAHASSVLFRESDSAGTKAQLRWDVRDRLAGPSGPERRGDWAGRYTALLVAADAACGALAWALALVVTDVLLGASSAPLWSALVAMPVWVLMIALCRGYERSKVGVGSDEMRAALRASAHGIVLAALLATVTQDTLLLATSVLAAVIAPVGGLLTRVGLRRWLHHRQRHGVDLRDTVVVGSMPQVQELAEQVAAEPNAGMRVVGVCVPEQDVARARAAGLVVLGRSDDVRSAVQRHGAAVVAVTAGQPQHYLRELAWSLEGLDSQLLVHPGLVEVAGPRLHIRPFIGLPLLAVEQPHFSGWRIPAKRATDLVLSSLGLLLAGPLMLVLAAAIRLSDGGPAIFRQTRVGRNGQTFTMYKFRSMHVDAEARLADLLAQNEGAGPLFKMVDDPRITRVGKLLRRTSLDELPQLFNILNGTMSVVGPRPPLPSEVREYQRPVRRRLLVTPGLTGLWQVSGRSALSWDESVRLDLRYVENWTLALDLLIIW